jgi:death-on-curing protein
MRDWLALIVYYGLNGIDRDAPDDEAYDLVIAVASGQRPYADVALVLRSWR